MSLFLYLEGIIVKKVLLLHHFLLSKYLLWYYNIVFHIPPKMLTLAKGRYLIVANHRKKIDPWIIFATLPRSIFRSLLPIRFFTANAYLDRWWIRVLLWSSGCFRAYSVEGKISGVKGGIILSDRGQALFIFPEGKCIKDEETVTPQAGVAYLVQQRNFTIIPVHVSYENSNTSRRTYVRWGEPLEIKHEVRTMELSRLAQKIFSYVQRLSPAAKSKRT